MFKCFRISIIWLLKTPAKAQTIYLTRCSGFKHYCLKCALSGNKSDANFSGGQRWHRRRHRRRRDVLLPLRASRCCLKYFFGRNLSTNLVHSSNGRLHTGKKWHAAKMESNPGDLSCSKIRKSGPHLPLNQCHQRPEID